MTNIDLNAEGYALSEDDILLEMDHEQDMLDAGRDRYFKKVNKERERGNASRTGGGKSIVSMLAIPVADAIVEEIARLESGAVRRKPPELRSLKLLPPRDTAILALMAVMDTMDLSRFCSDPESQLSGLSFECQGAFPSEG